MSLGYLHLILNHIPVLTLPIVLIFLLYSFLRKSENMIRFALLMTMLTSLSVLPVYLSGESAETIVEKVIPTQKDVIHSHEEAAEKALVLTLLVSVTTFFVLISFLKLKAAKFGITLVILTGIFSFTSLVYTAYLGGKIRHTEFTKNK